MIRAAARLLTLAAVLGFVALGVWQIERRAWKLALIADVEAKLAATPVAAPNSAGPGVAYRRVVAEGRWIAGRDTLVQAVTELGGGFWVMTPLETRRGRVLVNRGFVPAGVAPPPASGPARVGGLLRASEPGGGFLRSNDPAAGRWYSRDVEAIAAARGVAPVRDYFIDAERAGEGWPRGGMTVVRFRNTHLVYALTWFAMAGLLAWLAWRATRRRTA